MRRGFLWAWLTLLLLSAPAAASEVGHWTLEAEIRGARIEGMPLVWDKKHVFLLARDGRLWDFPPNDARNFRKTSSDFRSYSPIELRMALERELTSEMEVTGTTHYLVAHPRNLGSEWAGRFESLYASLVSYFSVRGAHVQEPQFPLVAIVWPRAADYHHYADAQGDRLPAQVIGYYSLRTNRVALYQFGDPRSNPADWRRNAPTIMHEAAHQTAFNIGVHNRFSPPPRWLAEGLGMLFEARGFYDSRTYTSPTDRVNAERLAQFRQTQATGRPSGAWVDLIGSDRMFEKKIEAAYAESWAFTFFLSETRPTQYSEFLARTAGRPNFKAYPAARRLADFKAVFGDNFPGLEVDFLRFITAVH